MKYGLLFIENKKKWKCVILKGFYVELLRGYMLEILVLYRNIKVKQINRCECKWIKVLNLNYNVVFLVSFVERLLGLFLVRVVVLY